MPELPEVQTVADHIKPDLIGKNVTGIEPVWKKVLHNFAKNDRSLLPQKGGTFL